MSIISNINEKIEVQALFNDNRIVPLLFNWRGRDHKVERVTQVWEAPIGERKIRYFFAVTDGLNFFELCFDTSDLSWSLCRVECEG